MWRSTRCYTQSALSPNIFHCNIALRQIQLNRKTIEKKEDYVYVDM